jgi:hypothetical protein
LKAQQVLVNIDVPGDFDPAYLHHLRGSAGCLFRFRVGSAATWLPRAASITRARRLAISLLWWRVLHAQKSDVAGSG